MHECYRYCMGEGDSMNDYKKPLPVIQPWTEAFWEATKQHKLLIQKCMDCEAKIFYPRKFCPECWSSSLSWSEAGGRAKVFSYTVTMAGVEEKFTDDQTWRKKAIFG